ncbi:hypothetical protein NBRC116594_14940 [Shimia sp. NS0008-38b]|uniref:hypothetical protein n=1 Tax=Shimia sp. NS0008-38b TaxID=3127653 RepID=UPI00310B27A3
MILFFAGLLATAGLAALVTDGSNDEEANSCEGLDEEDALRLDDGGVAHGTDCDDLVGFEQLLEAEIAGASVDLGAGNDLVDATPDDRLPVEIEIVLGAGDDTIVGPFVGSNLFGGAGDDVFQVEETDGEILSIDGGEGNDTIDARTTDNAAIAGGEGDDLIYSMGRAEGGTGYVINVDGGEGNDTLHVFADSDFAVGSLGQFGAVNGGEGTDHFIVAIDDQVADRVDLSAPYPAPWADLANEDNSGWRSNVVSLTDFDPTSETLELHLTSPNPDFEVASVHMEDEGVVVTYQSDSYPDLEMLIACDTAGLSWDQVTLVGAERSVLVGV